MTGAGAIDSPVSAPESRPRPAVHRSLVPGTGALLPGAAQLGPLQLESPTVLWARPDGSRLGEGRSGTPVELLVDDSVPAGQRALRLRQGPLELRLRFPVPTPEISGTSGLWFRVVPGVAYVHGPLSEAQWTELRTERPDLMVLGNARALWQDGEPFVQTVADLRRRMGGYPFLWTPRVALPHRLSLLAWLGVDLVDTTEGLWAAAQGTYLDATLGSVESQTARRHGTCPCPACQSEEPGSLEAHAEWVFAHENARVRLAVHEGRLRELVEARLTAEPAMAEMLRFADQRLGPLLEGRTPVANRQTRTYVLRESRRRPEVTRFLTRVRERYRPPPSKRVLLLVPCSRTKPYRNSRSHRRFARSWESWGPAPLLHVVSVSSPLGLVPRDLEDVFPARDYDIPVTGEWDEDEREAVLRALEIFVGRGQYTQAVVHLDPVEYRFLHGALPGRLHPRWTLEDEHTTSAGALQSLRSALEESDLGPSPPALGPLGAAKEGLKALARFQFGPEGSERLFAPPTRLEGRPWSLRLNDGRGVTLATWAEERGLFQLTAAGGERLLPANTLWVEVDPGVSLSGDLFTPGVRGADPAIAPGDAVLLRRDNLLLGVGEAVLSGPLMTELPRGLAVRVRHRAHRTDSSMSPASSSVGGPVV